MIKFNQMRYLPFSSQCDLALALARDIDRGDDTKRALLKQLFLVIQYFQRPERAPMRPLLSTTAWHTYFCPHCGLVVDFMGEAPNEPQCEECGAILEPDVEQVEPAGDGLDIPEFLQRTFDLPAFLPWRGE